MESHDDRRTHQRLTVPHVLVKISTPERMRVAYLKDLSRGGLFIKTSSPLALERLVDVDLLPPGRASPIRVRCKVVRVKNDAAAIQSNSQGMGLQFVDVDAEMMSQLDALLDEYKAQPPAVAEPAPKEETVQLKQALEDLAALTTVLAQRDRELAEARDRRSEIEARVMSDASPADELQRELETARAEIGDLQTRLSEALGDAEAYRHELAVMEQDDAGQRRLVESLEEKVEAERSRRLDVEGREANAAGSQVHLTSRISELEALVTEAQGPLAEAMSEVEVMKAQLEASRAQIGKLERSSKSNASLVETSNTQIVRLEQTAREALHELASANEEIEKLTRDGRDLASQLDSARTRLAVLEMPAAQPPRPSAPAGPAGEQFLRRLRENETLVRLPRFNTFTPSDPREGSVMGLLEGCDRFSDLCVLARSIASPAQLEKMLAGFQQLNLIGFEKN